MCGVCGHARERVCVCVDMHAWCVWTCNRPSCCTSRCCMWSHVRAYRVGGRGQIIEAQVVPHSLRPEAKSLSSCACVACSHGQQGGRQLPYDNTEAAPLTTVGPLNACCAAGGRTYCWIMTYRRPSCTPARMATRAAPVLITADFTGNHVWRGRMGLGTRAHALPA